MTDINIDAVSGFRRRIRIAAEPARVCAELEDDFHCMGVRLHHDGTLVTAIEPVMARAPWATCPGAVEVLQQTFVGIPLTAFVRRGEKAANCTHLHDLALLAAAHAFDAAPLSYDILVSDPNEGRQSAQLRRNGTAVLSWEFLNGQIIEPKELMGVGLDKMRPWIDALDPPSQEMARLLRWASMVAHGRTISWDGKPTRDLIGSGRCYSFQPQKLDQIKRVGVIRDFSHGGEQPLAYSPLAAPQAHHIVNSKRGDCSRGYAGRRTR